MRGFARLATLVFSIPIALGIAFACLYATLVAAITPQLPGWAQGGVEGWMLGTPQPVNSEWSDNGPSAATSSVGWDSYVDPNDTGLPDGIPLEGEPWLGCLYHDPNYSSHTGVDFPAYMNTPVYTTMAGKVVFVGPNGPWGNLVVIENNGYQVWLAHLNAFDVHEGQIVARGDSVGLSGDTGNSTGPHLHYGVMEQTETGQNWLDPMNFFGAAGYVKVPCQ